MLTVLLPHLTVASGIYIKTKRKTEKMNLVMGSFDGVACDAAGARLLGYDPLLVPYLRDAASYYKLGNIDIKKTKGTGNYKEIIRG